TRNNFGGRANHRRSRRPWFDSAQAIQCGLPFLILDKPTPHHHLPGHLRESVMSGALNETPLHAWHAANGGRLVDFAGWSMPVQYGSIIDEHQATRTAAGLFDVSHMGRLRI